MKSLLSFMLFAALAGLGLSTPPAAAAEFEGHAEELATEGAPVTSALRASMYGSADPKDVGEEDDELHNINLEGKFAFPHQYAMNGFDTEDLCQNDQGQWTDGLCFFRSSDTVEVSRTAAGRYQVKINTISTNAGRCSFEADGEKVGDNRIAAKGRFQEWDAAKGGYSPATCEVMVGYANSRRVSVSYTGNCRLYCGSNAELRIENALRERP